MRLNHRIILESFFLVIFLCLSIESWAYKEVVHQEITEKALTRTDSILFDTGWLESTFGFKKAINEQNQVIFNEGETIIGLIRQGAFDEDEGKRALNHFYDPFYGRGFDFNLPLSGHVVGVSSPNWMFEQFLSTATIVMEQNNSYLDALDYFESALVSNDAQLRREGWRNLFLTLGHLVHHIQDMSQPQHVRNDSHLDKYPLLIGIYNPSLYELFTREWGGFDEEGNRVREDKLFYGNYEVNHADFKTARDFWDNDLQTGIAEFSNRNFFSDATIYVEGIGNTSIYPSPILDLATTHKVQIHIFDLCIEKPEFCPEDTRQLNGIVTFMSTLVTDEYTDESFHNTQSVTYSIFDKDLEEEGILFNEYIFALNRFNYLMAQSILIPRATAYSTAILNHFFRGSLEISLPDEGVYSLIDHATENKKDVSGFREVKMKIRNTTATGEKTDDLGTWQAIVRFHRNNCYEPDLSGEYGSPGMSWQDCRSTEEEVLTSRRITLAPLGKDDEALEVTFSFDEPIPINTSDVYLQLMYRGVLGEEDDVVMVATKDISEPTYIALYNTLDQWKFSGLSFKDYYCRSESGTEIPYDECRESHWASEHYRFSAPAYYSGSKPTVAELAPLFSIAQIPVGAYGRVAVLTDLPSYTAFVLQEYWNDGRVYNPNDVVSVIQNQFDLESDNLVPIQYYKYRGAYIDERYIQNVAQGDYFDNLADFSPLTPVPSVIYSSP